MGRYAAPNIVLELLQAWKVKTNTTVRSGTPVPPTLYESQADKSIFVDLLNMCSCGHDCAARPATAPGSSRAGWQCPSLLHIHRRLSDRVADGDE
jgi:hypothetical protein